MSIGRRGVGVSLALVVCAVGVLVASSPGARSLGGATPVQRPNIVFVLTDDLAWNLVTPQYMPHVVALERQGATFSHYIVADSLCCPSRSSIFTGLFPHDTGVFTNTGSDGGYSAFQAHGDEHKTYAVAMQPGGYLTSMMGKYLNGYGQPTMTTYIPPGWSDWHVASLGYPEYNYDLNENGSVVHYGGRVPPVPDNYLTDVLDVRATAFINRAAKARKPFVMEVATFAPHAPYTPAPRNAFDFPGLKAPRTPAFDANNVNPPSWLGVRPPLTSGPHGQIHRIDVSFRKRAQAVEAVDRLIGDVEATLQARGLAGSTYLVFSSDNGYHMGEHRLLPGKQTAFDTDIRVPLIVAGPGVLHGRVYSQLVQNIDLYPTFVELAGGTPSKSVDGHSLVTLLHSPPGPVRLLWRTAALIEHHGPTTTVTDPDYENGKLGGNPTTYEAIRLANAMIANTVIGNAVYVEYANGEREYYNIDQDPNERINIYHQLAAPLRAQLHAIVTGLAGCHGLSACWTAARPR